MIDEKALSTMADIMIGIEQTDEWTELQVNDPGIKAAESRLNRALEVAEVHLPREAYMELSDAHCEVVSAYNDIAILYGMRVAEVIRHMTENPAELTRFWLENRADQRATQ